jgi:hypothetical protein
VRARAGVQLRDQTTLTSEQYVTEKAWRRASLKLCPRHPQGGCGFARHGAYARVSPPGMRVPRWYCPDGHITFSLLPDCLSSRLTGSLDEVERVIVRVEESRSMERACSELREEVELPGVLRWVRRRVQSVHRALLALVTAMPDKLGSVPKITAMREVLGTEHVLMALREIAAAHLQALPCPIGFQPLRPRAAWREKRFQHETGTDPPPKNA